MKKIVVMLLCLAAMMNVMATTYTAKAKVTLNSNSGYKCDLWLTESSEFGALTGSVMNMEDRVIALYALNGSTKLQIANAKDLSNVKLGLITDASTNYTFTVSEVEGATLYIHDNVAKTDYALTEGASYDFTATASTTNETRFYLTKSIVVENSQVCFTNDVLNIYENPNNYPIVIKNDKGNHISGSPFSASSTSIPLTSLSSGSYTVELGDHKFIIVKD